MGRGFRALLRDLVAERDVLDMDPSQSAQGVQLAPARDPMRDVAQVDPQPRRAAELARAPSAGDATRLIGSRTPFVLLPLRAKILGSPDHETTFGGANSRAASDTAHSRSATPARLPSSTCSYANDDTPR